LLPARTRRSARQVPFAADADAMALGRGHGSRTLTAAVWGSGVLLSAMLVHILSGWGTDFQVGVINDVAYIPPCC
jgi:hypothetical protein